jgi:hypothetical protein
LTIVMGEGLGLARVMIVAALAGVIGSPGAARADTPAEVQADRLFKEAKALTDKGQYSAACPKLEESQRLDPALGTEFNLADCYEHTGRAAEAQHLFRDVASLAHVSGKIAREKDARERAAGLDAQVATVHLTGPAIAAPGVEIRRDGIVVAASDLGQRMVLDAGDHLFEAAAPGKKPWRATAHLAPGARVEMTVPDLLDESAPPPPLPAPQLPAPTREGSLVSGQRLWAVVAGGLGVVGLGVGSAFGIVSISDHSSAKSACPVPNPCSDQNAAGKWSDATSAGNVSTIAFVAGGVLAAGAAALWLTAPTTRSTGFEWSPAVGPGTASVALRGRF